MKNKKDFVSIIVPCRDIDKYTKECIKHCNNLNYRNYEIIALPDKIPRKGQLRDIKSRRLRVIGTGGVVPAIKRNIGMNKAKGKIYAFIDSDAYPEKDWLKNAVKHLKSSRIGLVGGPNLTPKTDNFKQKISGMLLAAYFCGGRTSIRYRIAKEQETIELPSCNFLVKKEYATEFQAGLLTAEDTKFCFSIAKNGRKVMYEPDVVVWHHRREFPQQHLKQIWIYARDAASLLKRKGQFSIDKFYYSLLSLFILGVIGGAIVSFFSPILKSIYLSVLASYIFLAAISSIKKDIKAVPLIFLGIIATHFAYGLGFLYGLICKNKTRLNVR